MTVTESRNASRRIHVHNYMYVNTHIAAPAFYVKIFFNFELKVKTKKDIITWIETKLHSEYEFENTSLGLSKVT